MWQKTGKYNTYWLIGKEKCRVGKVKQTKSQHWQGRKEQCRPLLTPTNCIA